MENKEQENLIQNNLQEGLAPAAEQAEKKETDKIGEDHENTFITPGVIESKIEEKSNEKDEADVSEAKSCLRCGHSVQEGAKFCTECGLRLFAPEDFKKIGQKEIPNFSDKEKFFKLEYYKRRTDEYAEKYPQTVANMREIAKKAGFKNIFIVKTGQKRIVDDREVDSIYVEPDNYGKNAVFFPEEYLQNHMLIEKLDKDLADFGLEIVLFHEKEHCEDVARKADQISTVMETVEEYRDYISKYAGEKGFTDEEAKKIIERITRRNERLKESQTNTQVIVKNPEKFADEADVIEKIAISEAYMDAISGGIEGIKWSLATDDRYFDMAVRHYDKGYRALSDKLLNYIIIRQKEIEEELIRKYEEKYGEGKNK